MADALPDRRWEIIGAPFDAGSSHRGTSRGPSAIRRFGLERRVQYLREQGVEIVDAGDVESPPVVERQEVRGLAEMARFAPRLTARVSAALAAGRTPLVLGGDHSVSIASVAGVAGFLGAGATLGLIWVDAHPDLEISGDDATNALHAMSVRYLLSGEGGGLPALPGVSACVDPAHVSFIGLRDVEAEERRSIDAFGLAAHSASHVERDGIHRVCEAAFRRASDGTDGFVLSFDIDAMDPTVAPGVDYPQPGGLTVREGLVVMEFAARATSLRLLEFVEVNPGKDPDNVTSELAAHLIHRAMRGPLV